MLVPNITLELSDEHVSSPATDDLKVLIVGIKTADGNLAVNTPTQVFSISEIVDASGEGSQLAQMVRYFRRKNSLIHTTIVCMAAPAGVAATGTITFAGTATTAESLILQIEDKRITVPVAIGDDLDDVAAAAEAAIAEYPDLHVEPSSADEVLTLTARSIGIHGNKIRFRVLKVPPGITATPVAMASGTGQPDIAAALASLGAVRYNYIICPDAHTDSIEDIAAFLEDRFRGIVALDGHAIIGWRDTVGNLATLGLGEDTKQVSVVGDPYVPTNPWCQAAVVTAVRAAQDNPKVAVRDDNLTGIVAPPASERLDTTDQQTLLAAGITTYHYVQDVPRINRFRTLAKTNKLGQSSTAYRDLETKLTASEYRAERYRVLEPFLAMIWVEDASGTEYNFDVPIIDPEGIRQALITQYRTVLMPRGWVSKPDVWEADLIVLYTGAETGSIQDNPIINGNLYELSGEIAFRLGE